jgi:TRAP-type C4-dicarboxylate transport system substrate-binding protein
MRKKILSWLIASSCIVFVMAVSIPGPSTAAEAIKLRLSNALAPGTFQNKVLLPAFAKEVKDKSGGRVTVELYPGGQLFGHEETVEALTRGGVEMGLNSINHWVGFNPIFCWNDYPFLVSDLPLFLQKESKILPFTAKSLEKINAKILCFVPYSSTCIASKGPIEKPGDVKGLRIRGVSDPFFDAIKAWGGVPAAVSAGEMYDAIAKGTLDGVMTGWESIEARKLFEVTKFIVGPTSASIWGIFINLKTWNNLPQDVKAVIETAATNAYKMGFQEQTKIDEEAIKSLKNRGLKVKIFTSQENATWQAATKPAYDAFVKRCADKGEGEAAKAILAIFQ